MNERIEEFAAQAGFVDYMVFGRIESKEDVLEKFAELIVRECAKIVEGSSLPDAYSEPCLELIADDIREHFGVE